MKLFFFIYLNVIVLFAAGQTDAGKTLFYTKDSVLTDKIKETSFIKHIVKESDTAYVCRYYYKLGHMIKFETFSDSALTMRHGLFAWYNSQGEIDSVGEMYLDKRNDYWVYGYDDTFKPKIVEQYLNGNLLSRTGNYNNGNKDTPQITPAAFPGGLKKWTRYIESSLRVPRPFFGLIKGTNFGVVVVSIEINSEGKIINTFPLVSYEWKSDLEAMRIVRNSPLWIPATQGTKKVGYFHIQKITFYNEN